ncbi:MAG: hypothetical protein G01um101477_405 [Candidatus Doudnabacteria bacterium Gr01-1014_77]|uniref:Uncharacterized protein n=1 Tax=Candidatus Doudnabacteria bacterium Gr01-1014_77 TaxID=2017133 RepID=A0A554JB73_9BACT|nr:MAG: hypothetical protein G01um101477_405 [Candidatus Doudnabacteria bacterium Gr01-1014_77]
MAEDQEIGHEQLDSQEKPEIKKDKPIDAGEKPETFKIRGADQKVTSLVKRLENTKTDARNLSLVRERLGIETQGSTPDSQTNLAEIQDQVVRLEDEKKQSLQEHGEEDFPEGVSVSANEDGSEQKAKGPKIEQLEKDVKRTEEEQKKKRQELIDAWKEKAVKDFSKYLRQGWNTRKAINLDVVIALLETNLPKLIDAKTKDFVEGKTDQLPISVWMRHKGNSFLDMFAGRPQQIKEVTLEMDKNSFTLIDAKEIQDKTKEQEPSAGKPDQNKEPEGELKPESEETTGASDQGGAKKVA